jgi:hypothetical protein
MVETSASSISILRFDFKSIIKTKTGDLKKVLIEFKKLNKCSMSCGLDGI